MNAKTTMFITKELDALDDDVKWAAGVTVNRASWCNPGFASPMPWMEKAFAQTNTLGQTSPSVVCVMALVSPSTAWWKFCLEHAYEIRMLSPRVQFVPPPGIKKSSNSKENALIVFRRIPRGWPGAREWTWNWKATHVADDAEVIEALKAVTTKSIAAKAGGDTK